MFGRFKKDNSQQAAKSVDQQQTQSMQSQGTAQQNVVQQDAAPFLKTKYDGYVDSQPRQHVGNFNFQQQRMGNDFVDPSTGKAPGYYTGHSKSYVEYQAPAPQTIRLSSFATQNQNRAKPSKVRPSVKGIIVRESGDHYDGGRYLINGVDYQTTHKTEYGKIYRFSNYYRNEELKAQWIGHDGSVFSTKKPADYLSFTDVDNENTRFMEAQPSYKKSKEMTMLASYATTPVSNEFNKFDEITSKKPNIIRVAVHENVDIARFFEPEKLTEKSIFQCDSSSTQPRMDMKPITRNIKNPYIVRENRDLRDDPFAKWFQEYEEARY